MTAGADFPLGRSLSRTGQEDLALPGAALGVYVVTRTRAHQRSRRVGRRAGNLVPSPDCGLPAPPAATLNVILIRRFDGRTVFFQSRRPSFPARIDDRKSGSSLEISFSDRA